jgi:hypothetical protein
VTPPPPPARSPSPARSWVQMTPEQRQYYRAIYGKQIGALLAGASTKTMPQLRNLAMELRKVCCHPVSGALRGRAFWLRPAATR